MDEKIMKDAQYRKGLSIGFFNSTNSAISLVAASLTDEEKENDGFTDDILIDRVRKFRDVFIEDHKVYYATIIANIGIKYVPGDAIKKIKETKSIEELKNVWLSLSEDERRDGEILKAKEEMKEQYETIR